MHVAEITTNVKGGGRYTLGPRTLVVGRNGAGKSGLLAAIELVLTGRSTEIGALPAELLTLAPDGQPLKVEATLSSGQALRFSVAGTTARAKRAEWSPEGPHGVLLGREVAAVLGGRPDRLRAALLAVAAADVSEATVAASIPAAFADEWQRLVADARAGLGADAPMADVLIAVSEAIRHELRVASASADEGPRPEVPSDDEIVGLRVALDAARVGDGGNGRRADAIRAAEAAIVAQQVTLARAGDAPGTVVAWCLCCGREDVPVADLVAARDATLAWLARARGTQPVDDGPVRAAEAALMDALGRRALADEWDRRRADRLREAARADALRALEGCVRRIVEETLPAAVGAFVERANRAVAGDVRLGVQLFDRRKPVCRIGLERTGRMIPWRALSGAERARCLAALASAWAAGRTEPVRLVAIDEAWLDPDSLTALLDGLGRAVGADGGPTQAVVCVVGGEEVRAPEGWVVVRL